MLRAFVINRAPTREKQSLEAGFNQVRFTEMATLNLQTSARFFNICFNVERSPP